MNAKALAERKQERPAMTDPSVSVLCLAYNHAAYIADALEGILSQVTSFDCEVLIHDDASSDGTSEIISEYVSKYPGLITTITQRSNVYSQGIKPSSVLLPISRGRYLAYCEGDDYWTDRFKLEKQVAFMESRPELSMSFHPALQILETPESPMHVRNSRPPGDEIVSDREVIVERGNFYPTVSAMFRRDAVSDHFLALAHLRVPGDHLLAVASVCAGKVGYISDCMAVFRRNRASITQSYKYNLDGQAKAELLKRNAEDTLYAFEYIDKYTKSRFGRALAESRRRYICGWMTTNIAMLRMGDAWRLNRMAYKYLSWPDYLNVVPRYLLKALRLRWTSV